MSDYQVIARRFRPQFFKEVVGQQAIVTTLKNAIKFKRLAQAYLFCGSRGTGKTTLARIFAKALNCHQPLEEGEPCGECASCRDIAHGSSLDVIEIDGASHRGIDDIRQINETVGYAAAAGGYKIYIIDEVHMLTKEAFNALLKTLEEPPPKVKFFFATTEPHKVLPTILSRCQRFNLNRIPVNQIVDKLQDIASKLNVEIEREALQRIALRAEGGLRDAESLLDQAIAFSEGRLTLQEVDAILGLMPRETFFELDQAGKEGNLAKAFEVAHRIFSEGKDLAHFIEGLVDHFRTILLIKLSGQETSFLYLNPDEKEQYLATARLYTQEQCLELIDYLVNAQQQIRSSSFGKLGLETILLHVLRSRYRLSIGQLVARLSEIEAQLGDKSDILPPPPSHQAQTEDLGVPKQVVSSPAPIIAKEPAEKTVTKPPKDPLKESAITEDPTPSLKDLGKAVKKAPVAMTVEKKEDKPLNVSSASRALHEYDTLLQFAAVELEGRLQRHN